MFVNLFHLFSVGLHCLPNVLSNAWKEEKNVCKIKLCHQTNVLDLNLNFDFLFSLDIQQ